MAISGEVTHVALIAIVLWSSVGMRIWLERRLLARDECLAGVHGVGRPHSEVLKMCGLEDRLGSRWHEDGGLKVGLWYEL